MAGAVLKIFGILFLLVGIVLALAGVGAAVFGALDEKDHQEDQGPLGIGKDDDRQQADQALIAGGATAVGIGIVLIVAGIIFLLVGGRDRSQQQQQQVVLSTGGDVDLASQQQQTYGSGSNRRTGFAVAGVVALLLLVVVLAAGLAGENPISEALNGQTKSPIISSDSHIGNMGPSMFAGAGLAYGGHEQEFVAPYGTQRLTAQYTWGSFTGGADRLRLTVTVDTGSGFESVASRIIAPGDLVELDGDAVVKDGDWSGMTVRFRIAPADPGIYQGQPFEGVLQWMR